MVVLLLFLNVRFVGLMGVPDVACESDCARAVAVLPDCRWLMDCNAVWFRSIDGDG